MGYVYFQLNRCCNCCSVAKWCPTLFDPMECTMPGSPVLCLPKFAQIRVHWVGNLSNHLILICPLLLLPSIFPSIRAFSNESSLHIRWPKNWSFSFSISPSEEDSWLISFRIDWFDFLESKEVSRVFFGTTIQKHQFFSTQSSLWSNSHICAWLLEKPKILPRSFQMVLPISTPKALLEISDYFKSLSTLEFVWLSLLNHSYEYIL